MDLTALGMVSDVIIYIGLPGLDQLVSSELLKSVILNSLVNTPTDFAHLYYYLL